MRDFILVILLLVSILSSQAVVRADDAEDDAIEQVQQMSGKVIRDDKLPGKPVITVFFIWQ